MSRWFIDYRMNLARSRMTDHAPRRGGTTTLPEGATDADIDAALLGPEPNSSRQTPAQE
jgi:hypothetical protein